MKNIYFVGNDGQVWLSEWGFGKLRSLKKSSRAFAISRPGTIVFGVGGEIAVQALPLVKGSAGFRMVSRKINAFSGANDLAIATIININERDKRYTWRFAKMDNSQVFGADARWWILGVESIFRVMGWRDQILVFELGGSTNLAAIDHNGFLVGYHQGVEVDTPEIARIIQSWRGRNWGNSGVITIDRHYEGSLTSSWGEIGNTLGLGRKVVRELPALIFCHPKILRRSPNIAPDEMRHAAKQRRISAVFYACAVGVAIGSLWLAGGLYRSGVADQDVFFRVEEERRALAAKIDASREVLLGKEEFLKTALTVADSIGGGPGLQDGFEAIANAGLDERIYLEKLSISKTDEKGVSIMRMIGTITPIFQTGKVYSATLKFLQRFCNLLSEKNPAIVESAKIENLGFIVGDNNASITEPAASLEAMPFQILVRMRRAV